MAALRVTTTATRKWLGALLMVAACAFVLIVIGTLSGATDEVRRPADREAESFADGYLLQQLNIAAADSGAAGGERVAQVEILLTSMTGERVTGSHETILVGPRKGTSFPVAIYSYWEDTTFSGAGDDAYYGRACHVYTVGTRAVTSVPINCPTSVPEQPSVPALTSDGWPLG
ncbi:hypothetical protein [Microbacterium sp. NPDC058389]|uniref:hypothetical protein n=1 Tax=Microbacterium sp. NPDC058389 TaxID=3346475 RepID=UPI00365CA8EE